ncbi:MAG: hypothetical protein LBO79_03615 [Zoogloeaceae bacterium]|jgi:tRNA A-37 threonylcarbamoyl transferase component Bud32|nr:hypothetical protein [Zoogloeaceae bacterium]
MRDFLADEDRPLLERHGLATFDALWKLDLPTVDDPNIDRGGWSAVCRLDLDGRGFFLKRQCNHRTRGVHAPFGEPTFAREFRNIQRYQARGVPAARAAFYAERRLRGDARGDGLCAVLLTRALDGWRDLATALEEARADDDRRHRLLAACGVLARRLHRAGLIHCCFYPRHIFARETVGGGCEACLIDLEKTRPLLLGRRDRVKDLEQFLRHTPGLDATDVRVWLSRYLDRAPEDPEVAAWIDRLHARRQSKETRPARRIVRRGASGFPGTDANLASLESAGRTPPLPLHIHLPGDAGSLTITRLLRVLPGQRYVGVARWRLPRNAEEKTVLAKLLTGGRAERRAAREREGARLLRAWAGARENVAGGPGTPRLLSDGFAAGQGGWLLFELLEDARSLEALWRDATPETRHAALREALRAIASLHRAGLWQADLHPGNLLYDREDRLHLIDGGGVHADTAPLPQEKAMDNLGVFLAQFPDPDGVFADRARMEALLREGGVFGANVPAATAWEALQAAIRRARRWRVRDLLKKIRRDCTLFAVERKGLWGASGLVAVRRAEAATLAPLLSDPDACIRRGHVYKTGGAATVVRVEIAGRALIVKRYNIKHFWHGLKHCWRPGRAWRAWREGHRLLALGIPTARPLALLERRCCWLRGTAYLVTEHLEGPDLLAHAADTPLPGEKAEALRALLASLHQARISHGDMKGHNLIWQPNATQETGGTRGHWALIDLDATRQHLSSARFARAHARDLRRLLENWPAGAKIREQIPRDSITPHPGKQRASHWR